MSKQNIDKGRRQFIVKGAVGFAGLTMLPTVLRSEAQEKSIKKGKIIYRTLGKTGIRVPIVSMGVMNADNPKLVQAALGAGIFHLDTAHAYQRGRNEELIAGVLKNKSRDSYLLATKVVAEPVDRKTGLYTKKTKAGPFIEKFEISLKRLNLDYVDILYHHSVVRKEAALFEPILEAMVKLREQGKVRFLGVSTHSNEPEVIRTAAETKAYDVVLTAYNFRQPHREEVKQAIARAAKQGIGIVAMKTQAGVYWDKAKKRKINMKAALKWVLQDENVHTTIPGFTTFDQLEEALSAMANPELTSEEMADLEEGKKLGLNGLYCDQCRVCLAQCPRNLEIPTIMRSYMYAYGYRNLAAAKETMDGLALDTKICSECDSCAVECPMGFNVQERITDIARVRNIPEDFLA